jgi:tetratricopeptide (TPR) repeat protein
MKYASIISTLAMAIGLSVAVSGAPAFAFGDGSNSGTSDAPIVCKKGYVYSQKEKICVKASSSLLDDKQLYEQGRDLAKAGYYEHALPVLFAVKNQNDPMVLTMIGYAKRKMGDIAGGFDFYNKALAIDPNNINTREYLGEGYVTLGRIDLAEVELARIEKIGGRDTEQYEALELAITGGSTW